ncbi:MAG: divergent polysaccharide deacetylase family protein [Pyramidobacter sp.]|jgi:polysaccharide deacetylase 2 family uncharacterized protein YibQ
MRGRRAFFLALLGFAAVCVVTAAFNGEVRSIKDGELARNSDTGADTTVQSSVARRETAESGAPLSPDELSEGKDLVALSPDVAENVPARRDEKRRRHAASCPLIALVIDDMGYNFEMAEEIDALGVSATWAVIPGTPQCDKIITFAQKRGQPFILHVPMQAISDADGSGYAVGVDTDEKKISAYLGELYKKYPQALGVNNHRGSRATSDRKTMQHFMKAMSSRRWGFLDSRTIGKSVAYQTAVGYDIPAARNNAFIDGSPDLEIMKAQFSKALRHARKRGTAVAICHARKTTLPFLEYLVHADIKPVAFATLDEIWERQRAYHKEEKQ